MDDGFVEGQSTRSSLIFRVGRFSTNRWGGAGGVDKRLKADWLELVNWLDAVGGWMAEG